MQLQLLAPHRFRFTDPGDAEQFGDRWWVWDEAAVARLRGRQMIALEEIIGMPIVEVFAGVHRDRTAEKMAAMWIAMHLDGHPVAWSAFDPIVHLTAWEESAGPLDDSGEDPPPTASDSSPAPTAESATS